MAADRSATIQTFVPGSGFAQVITGTVMTRPANTTVYASGQLVANSTTAGSVVPISFAGVVTAAGEVGRIYRVRIKTSSTSVTLAQFRVHFYNATVVPVNGDGAAWSTPVGSYIGACDVTVDRAFSDGAEGAGVPLIGTSMHYKIPSGTTLYALLEARAAYVPTSAGTFTLILESLQL